MTLSNSTIANNTAGFSYLSTPYDGHRFIAAGLQMTPLFDAKLDMQSTLITNNVYGTSNYDSDFSTYQDSAATLAITGGNNLIYRAEGLAVPGTVTGNCPILGALHDNGGETQTLALLSHSPGVNQGNNKLGLADDQRGAPYVRLVGGATDIGAYEIQSDIVFDNNFEGCAALPISQ